MILQLFLFAVVFLVVLLAVMIHRKKNTPNGLQQRDILDGSITTCAQKFTNRCARCTQDECVECQPGFDLSGNPKDNTACQYTTDPWFWSQKLGTPCYCDDSDGLSCSFSGQNGGCLNIPGVSTRAVCTGEGQCGLFCTATPDVAAQMLATFDQTGLWPLSGKMISGFAASTNHHGPAIILRDTFFPPNPKRQADLVAAENGWKNSCKASSIHYVDSNDATTGYTAYSLSPSYTSPKCCKESGLHGKGCYADNVGPPPCTS